MMTNFIEQMNILNDLFLEHIGTYFGNSEQYKFLSTLDGSLSDASEMNQDGERGIARRARYVGCSVICMFVVFYSFVS